jgi:putative phage-type endonuclease
MKILDCLQGTPEWLDARKGIPTASNFCKIITPKGERSKQREKYLYKVAAEAISGIIEETYQNAAMERGILMEAEARKFYSMVNDVEVQEVGFCLSDDEKYGCSPDGIVGEGILEIKCPLPATHIGYLIENKLPADYIPQVQGQLLVTGAKWCDFISYAPGIKPLVIRAKPNKTFLSALQAELEAFIKELDEIVRRFK